MCFNQDGVITSVNGKPLKLVYQFIYTGEPPVLVLWGTEYSLRPLFLGAL